MKLGKKIISALCAVLMVLTLIVAVPGGASAATTPRSQMIVESGKTYVLEAYCGKVVDIKDQKKGDGINAHLWKRHNGNTQRYVLTLQDTANYGYTMRNVGTGYYLDVAGVSRASGANIYQWSYTGAANQLWYLEDAGSGYVYIRSGMGTYMNVAGNKTSNGTNIETYAFSSSNSQKFRIRVLNGSSISDAPLSRRPITVNTSKTYSIEAYCGKVVEIAGANPNDTANVQIWDKIFANHQIFSFSLKNYSTNAYAITCVGTGGSLDVAGISSASGANIWQCHYTGTGAANQLWYLEDAGDGYVYIRSGMGTYVDVSGNGTANGTNIQAYAFNATNAQKFRLVETQAITTPGKTLAVNTSANYTIETYFGKAVDVNGMGRGDGVNIMQWEHNYCNAQKWVFTLADSKNCGYTMKCVGTDKYADVSGVSRASGANIHQWSYTGAANQIWYLQDAGSGYVYIRSGMGTYLSVAGNSSANGANVQADSFSGAIGQRFRIKLASSSSLSDAKLYGSEYASYSSLPKFGGSGSNAMNTSSLTAERNNAWNTYSSNMLSSYLLRTETANKSITVNGKTMRYTMTVKGTKPADGYPLYIALHGGGGGSASMNNSQWSEMQTRYVGNMTCGVYVAPRGLEDVWNMHFMDESFPLFDRLIQYMILTQGVNPNKVYIEGYSAGGDGVYGVTARMADRFAAANMTAGHPNGVSIINLKNMPIQLQVGENDSSYNRNKVTAQYDAKLNELQRLYGGYIHRTYIHYNTDHGCVPDCSVALTRVIKDPQAWLNYGDRTTVQVNSYSHAFMNQFTRDPLPTNVIWDLTTRALSRETTSFYYLSAPKSATQGLIQASYNRSRNTVVLKTNGVNGDFSVLLNENMVDFDRPITFEVNGKSVTAMVTPDRSVLQRTTNERGDPNYQFEAEISYSALKSLIK